MIKAIIFDLNGVFIQSPPLSERFKKDFGVSPKEFLPALKDVMTNVRLPGAGRLYTYWKPCLDSWGVGLSGEELCDYWFGAEKEVPEMTALARELKAVGIRVFILSNNFRERSEHYGRTFAFLSEVPDAVYYSWRTGFVKPDERAYRFVLSENGLKPEECIYFDDSEINVGTASSLGIRSFVFFGAEETRQLLLDVKLPSVF